MKIFIKEAVSTVVSHCPNQYIKPLQDKALFLPGGSFAK
jgi:hypothetical protein